MKTVGVFWSIPEDKNCRRMNWNLKAQGCAQVLLSEKIQVPEDFKKENSFNWVMFEKRNDEQILAKFLGEKWSEIFAENENEILRYLRSSHNKAEVVANLNVFAVDDVFGKLKDFSVNFFKEKFESVTSLKVEDKVYTYSETRIKNWTLTTCPDDNLLQTQLLCNNKTEKEDEK